MTPVQQIHKHQPEIGIFGDCYRTAIACVLDLRPEEVPHFYENWADDGEGKARQWLAQRGFIMVCFGITGDVVYADVVSHVERSAHGEPWIMGGKSPRGTNHSVVVQHGRIVCDPATGAANAEALVGPATCDDGREVWFVEVIARRLSYASQGEVGAA